MNQLKFAFGLTGLFSFYGIVSMTMWLLGDRFGYNYTYRIVIIGLVLLTLPVALVTGFVVSRRKKKAEKAEADAKEAAEGEAPAGDGKAQKVSTPTGNYTDLSSGAEEVVQFLKTSNLGEGGKDAVYSLPWYLVAGVPKSGKSSLVLGSNLNFQTLPSQRQSEQKFVRTTQNVDWRVTSDAVFVDTAGRYQTEGIDQDEWASLLETIKKVRPARPLDGFLLVISADKILNANDREVEEIAKVLRANLDDAIQRTKTRFPVYLIFTNADSIEGFRDSFSTSKNEAKNLVWGATIPLEKSDNAQTLFDGEYEILHNSLMKRRLMRLSAPFPPVRQLRIFNFPLHFGSARRKIGSFVSTLFRPNPFSESPFLRGFYFTAAPTNRQQVKGAETMANIPQTIGNSYFTEKLFRDVVLRDKDLVRTFQQQKQRPPILGWVLTFLGAFLTLVLLAMAGISLYNNKAMLDEAVAKGSDVLNIVKSDAGKNPLDKKPEDTVRELDATEDLRQLMAKLDDYDRNSPPPLMRFGFYSGNRIYKESLLPIYFSVVEQRFKKPMVERVKRELGKFATSPPVGNPAKLNPQEEENLGKNYDLLKAYLMLTNEYKDNAEASHLSTTLKDYWKSESKTPPDMEIIAQQQLEYWAKQVDRNESPGNFPRFTLEKPLVESVRKKLQAFPAYLRYYKRKVTEISKQVDEKIGPTTAAGLLTRNSADTNFVEGAYTVPGAFTLEGYKLMKTAISEADKELSADDWVMGEQGKNAITEATDTSKIEELYLRDYTDHWTNFVKNVNVKSYSKENAKDALQVFASESSPMKILMKEIARNTNFSAKPEATGWLDWLLSFVSKAQPITTGGNTPVEKAFLPLFTFMGNPEKPPAPIDAYQSEIGKVSSKFNQFSVADINQIAEDLAKNDDNKKFPELKTSSSKIESGLGVFNSTPAGQELANLLKEPLENLSSLLGASAKTQLSKTWADQLLPQAKEVEKGFPFEDSQNETDLKKLTDFLNPVNGSFSKFFEVNLKKDFEGDPGQIKEKETSKGKYNPDFVAYLNRAFLLRDVLFGKNAAPVYEYEFKLQPVQDTTVEITVDGQTITSEGTASVKLKFPAPTATETGVIMKLATTGGTTSTPGNTSVNTSANSSNSNVNSSSTTNSAPKSNFLQNNTSDSTSSDRKFPGTWGLFKFFNDGNPQKNASGEWTLTYKLGSKTVTVIIKPSGGDIFDKDLFKLVRAPQTLLK